jgi:hypothetical protein
VPQWQFSNPTVYARKILGFNPQLSNISVGSDKGLLQPCESFGLFIHMKSALLAAIFGITGGVAILLAVPAEGKAPVVKIHPAKWAEDAPLVPQIEKEDLVVPEPLEHYSVAQAKPEKQAPRRYRHVARPRPNFFEKLVVGFMNLQKHQPAKSSRKRSRTN